MTYPIKSLIILSIIVLITLVIVFGGLCAWIVHMITAAMHWKTWRTIVMAAMVLLLVWGNHNE